ncbi:7SK snRNA methylphosphate capping enzyme bin3-like isoform X1 [Argiope bruennichi]|uniref:RNA methyltransferase n=1 Tax=Argiope bruennichi TaxID=94029 RepID=A0A8T0FPF8_ARGBR|nr:7SK snRNA methylphosphate capping enzyme bin3-like isoform X1 [Argiope bruennichi]KAF8791509.1 7SK snRNA methylphosphate capping enzyme like protein [Argiope bruennichi]
MPSSPIHKFPLSDDSANNSLECTANISDNCEEKGSANDMKRFTKYRLSQGHALLRKQVQRPIILHATKGFGGRRRYTFSGQQDNKLLYKKRRRFTSIALPTKFLLGGNRNDPLNLSSLQDEKINQQLNAFSPASSPMPLPDWRTQVQVVIPQNIYDPLNLNTGEDIEFNLLSSKPRRRRRHRKGKKDDENVEDANQISPSEEVPPSDILTLCHVSVDDPNGKDKISSKVEFSDDQNKIVSPVVPQGSPVKTFKKSVSRSISREAEEKPSKLNQLVKYRSPRSRDRQNDTIKFRVNAAKFCYGNHVANIANWNFGDDFGTDPRLRFFNQDMFREADVLDIGCNTGQIALHIAKHWHPRKVVGIDIDKKLINKAQRKVRLYLSEHIAQEEDFPDSMAVMYGPLSKLVISKSKAEMDFPNNVTFFEANYVPAKEDYLETQKPEFDTILCLRVTKWIHLNFGDEGLKMAFKRMFAQLRNGGRLILEYQPWFTYSASKRITPAIYKTYQGLEMRPDSFCDYLLSEVGFSSCRLIGRSYNCTKAYRQEIFLLTKGSYEEEPHVLLDPSSLPYNYHMWYPRNEFATYDEHPHDAGFSDYAEENHEDNGYSNYDDENDYECYGEEEMEPDFAE